MSANESTIETYNQQADTFAERFSNERILTEKLDELFGMVGKNPNVFDIGCGNGKYASAVLERGGNYLGLDASYRLIEIGESQNPEARFIVGDMVTAEYPKNIDIILSITSIVHIGKEELAEVLAKSCAALKSGGVMFLSCKEMSEYQVRMEGPEEAQRKFFYYTKTDIEEVLPSDFQLLGEEHESQGSNNFLSLTFKKV